HEQIVLGMKPDVEWLYEVLSTGEFPSASERTKTAWPEDGGEVVKNEVIASFRDFVPGSGNRPASPSKAGLFLKKWIPGLETTRPTLEYIGRTWCYSLPSLAVAREAFLKVHPTFSFNEHDTPSSPPHAPAMSEVATPSGATAREGERIVH